MKLMLVLCRKTAARRPSKFDRLLGLSVFLLALSISPAAAAYSLVEGYYYNHSDQVKAGMYVSLVKQGDNEVEPTTSGNLSTAVGVATQEDRGLLTLANDKSNVYVARSGLLPVFVTDLNGPIRQGDLLTISPVAGVLTKATPKDSYVLGVASGDFNSAAHPTETILLPDGSSQAAAKIGQVDLYVKPLSNPDRAVPNQFLEMVQKVIKKPVSLIQVILAGVFFVLTIFTAMTMMGNAVRGTLAALGRNPLAKASVLKGLSQLSLLAFAVLVIGLAGTWLILWI